jgi:hypothetical protein
MLRKYGVEHPILSDEILDKIRKTCNQRYGHDVASKSQIVIDKIRTALGTDEVRERTRATCLSKFGATSYQLSLIPPEIRDVLDSKDTFESLVTTYGITGTADSLGVSVDTVRSRLQKFGITLSFKSGIQQEVLHYINTLDVGDVLVDCRSIISPKEIDIYHPARKFAIEVNGSYWHSELNGKDKRYHLSKLENCADKDIELFFVWEHLWNSKRDIVKSRISNKFGKNAKVYARKCNIVPVSKKEKKKFLDENHLQGDCNSSVE